MKAMLRSTVNSQHQHWVVVLVTVRRNSLATSVSSCFAGLFFPSSHRPVIMSDSENKEETSPPMEKVEKKAAEAEESQKEVSG